MTIREFAETKAAPGAEREAPQYEPSRPPVTVVRGPSWRPAGPPHPARDSRQVTIIETLNHANIFLWS